VGFVFCASPGRPQAEFGTTSRINQACLRATRDGRGHGAPRTDLVQVRQPKFKLSPARLQVRSKEQSRSCPTTVSRKGEGTVRYSRSKEHPDATMGSTLTFPSRATRAEPQVLPYGTWLTDARLSSLGFSAQDIGAIRSGEPIGRVVARRKGRSSAPPAGSSRETSVRSSDENQQLMARIRGAWGRAFFRAAGCELVPRKAKRGEVAPLLKAVRGGRA
jgi:hypothetical protein